MKTVWLLLAMVPYLIGVGFDRVGRMMVGLAGKLSDIANRLFDKSEYKIW